MKKLPLALLLITGITSCAASANNHTVQAGYAQGKASGFSTLHGVNLQYHYQMDSLVSLMTSVTWMKGDDELSQTTGKRHLTHHVDAKYYSILFGPSFRINDYASFYLAGGPARVKAQGNIPEINRKYNGHKASFAYGAGFVFNINENFTINAGYEGSRINFINDYTMNIFNIGIGYNF